MDMMAHIVISAVGILVLAVLLTYLFSGKYGDLILDVPG
jgi:hypothetical protein